MENVEYSAEYHRPDVRWIYSQKYVTTLYLLEEEEEDFA